MHVQIGATELYLFEGQVIQRCSDAKKDNCQLEVGEGDGHRKEEQIQREKLSHFSSGTAKIDKDTE